MNFTNFTTPRKPRPPPGQQGSTPFRSATASRFRSSLVPMNRPSPARPLHPPSKLTTTANVGRDLFRTSTPQTTRSTKFAPSLPADATKATPTARKFVSQKSGHGGMSSTASTEPFKMRIPSPDPKLSGEALSKEVPEDPSRTGTIYADQFLAHKCPRDFDDLQRRQFFCILDLRRLKYAANEIFAKKDWKLNIMNFAKEYEKSRGLIMLRYGLYEFKNVKPSEEVLKRWRATHGLPDPEPEEQSSKAKIPSQHDRPAATPSAASTKRKAEDALAPKDTALTTSANQNKRRNLAQETPDPILTGPAPFKKSKRKADETDEPDENQPSKIQKPTPSAATSKFESILNKAQTSSASSPMKRNAFALSAQATAPFGAQSSKTTSDSNPFAASVKGLKPATTKTVDGDSSTGSVLADHKVGSKPATNASNIFSYLSESSPSSSGNENGNVDGDGETESESESEQEQEDSQDAAPSEQPSAAPSTGTSTPPTQGASALFSANKPGNLSNPFSGTSSSFDATPKGGLFGRVQMGSDGQPLRATPSIEEKNSSPSTEVSSTEKDATKTPAKQPGDYTFNHATTPISFGQSVSSTPKPPATSFNTDSVREPNKPANPLTAKPPSIFGVNPSTTPASQPTTTQALFGGFNKPTDTPKPQSNNTGSSIFASQKTAATPSTLFGASPAKPSFGNVGKVSESDSPSPKESEKETPSVTTPTIASAVPDAEAKEPAPAPKEQPKSIFGASTTPAPKEPPKSIFGTSTVSAPKEQPKSIFGASTANIDPAKTPFGNTQKADEPKSNGDATTNPLFGSIAKPTTPSAFGTTSNITPFGDKSNANDTTSKKRSLSPIKRPASGFAFGNSKPDTTTEAQKSSGGPDQTANGSTGSAETKSIFGFAPSKSPALAATPIFGNKSTTPTSSFASGQNGAASPEKKQDEPATSKPGIFNNGPSTVGSVLNFGAPASNNSQPSTTSSFIFGATPKAPPAVSFGASNSQTNGSEPAKPAFQLGGAAPSSGSASFTFGQSSSSGADTGFTFTAGGNGQSVNNPFASSNAPSSTAPVFGGKPSTPTPPSSFNFNFGQQAPSTPNPPPTSQGSVVFGGASSKANGAPGFSFTQATPPQNSPNPFGPKPTSSGSGVFGSSLQAGGDQFTGSNSPFPAPSSIGTTPRNGTPEPQSQNGDDAEAPHEQISLTNGGPGEEDEIILHEVRAKAIKYVPIVKGSEEDQEKKSPWTTQGVGPLRVLKNKTTGTVRILLRAEPRGHIAMNKTILSDTEYKTKDKTVNFVAASDDGSCLETWVLQVKKPEFALQLAGVMEANKGANKK